MTTLQIYLTAIKSLRDPHTLGEAATFLVMVGCGFVGLVLLRTKLP